MAEHANDAPNQNNCEGNAAGYLDKAAEACAAGDLLLGMHLYLAAYEKAANDRTASPSLEVAALREAWHLSCDLKERSLAEYVFEKLEPYLTGEEIAECALKLQELALDRLEQYGFSREELEDMAEAISQDFLGEGASIMKVESINIPNLGAFGATVSTAPFVPAAPADSATGAQSPAPAALAGPAGSGALAGPAGPAGPDALAGPAGPAGPDAPASPDAPDAPAGPAGSDAPVAPVAPASPAPAGSEPDKLAELEVLSAAAKSAKPPHVGVNLADADSFNPYDEFKTSSVGKSYHVATTEGSGAYVFTRDEDRASELSRAAEEKSTEEAACQPSDDATPDQAEGAQASAAQAQAAAEDAAPDGRLDLSKTFSSIAAALQTPANASAPAVVQQDDGVLRYGNLVGYDEAVSIMRDIGVGRHNDPGFLNFVRLMNERHGLDRMPSPDTLLFRAPAIEDASRFAEATVGELGLPVLRMNMEEGMGGMPVLCVTTQGNNRPRMNHAHNRFEAPGILVIEDLDMWVMPEIPEGPEGIGGFMMANISRGAREAVNLIRSAVEDPDVFVLATASTTGEPDPFFYDLLEPITIVDIGNPTEKERADIWDEIARDHPSMRGVDKADLLRYSEGLPRYDIYMCAREAVEDAYKLGLVRRTYIPVSTQLIFEKLAACQMPGSERRHQLEEAIIEDFRDDLDHLEDLLG